MNYCIKHETDNSVRVRFEMKNLDFETSSFIERKLMAVDGVDAVKMYRGVGGATISFKGKVKENILETLSEISISDICDKSFEEKRKPITYKEYHERGIDKEFRNKLRKQICLEAAADMFLPGPAQFAVHAYEFMKIK